MVPDLRITDAADCIVQTHPPFCEPGSDNDFLEFQKASD